VEKFIVPNPPLPTLTFSHKQVQLSSWGQEQLVGGDWLQASYQDTIYISRASAEQLHEIYGQCFLLETGRLNGVGRALAQ